MVGDNKPPSPAPQEGTDERESQSPQARKHTSPRPQYHRKTQDAVEELETLQGSAVLRRKAHL
jgi:hypothetical protein